VQVAPAPISIPPKNEGNAYKVDDEEGQLSRATSLGSGITPLSAGFNVVDHVTAVKRTQDHRKRRKSDAKTFRSASGFRRNSTAGVYLSVAPEDRWDLQRWNVALFMESTPVKAFMMGAIVVNAVIIGVEADYGDDSLGWLMVELAFLVIFTTELVLNLIGFGKIFFLDPWNWIDFFVVASSLLDFFITLIVGAGSSGLSVLRLIRLIRVLRVISFIDKLVYLVAAFAKGMESAGWVLVLLLLALYIFAVLGKAFFGDSVELTQELDGQVDIQQLFGTIPKSLVTLIQLYTYDSAVTGVYRPIGEARTAAWLYFMAFMVVVSIGIMELLTAIFIDSLMEEKRELEKRSMLEAAKQRKEVDQLIQGLFQSFDVDSNQSLDTEELEQCMAFFDDEETQALLRDVQIDPKMMQEAIRLSDIDGNGEVTPNEFVTALESIHTQPRIAHIRELHQKLNSLKDTVLQEIQTSKEETAKELSGVNDRLARIEALLISRSGNGDGTADAQRSGADDDPEQDAQGHVVVAASALLDAQPRHVSVEEF